MNSEIPPDGAEYTGMETVEMPAGPKVGWQIGGSNALGSWLACVVVFLVFWLGTPSAVGDAALPKHQTLLYPPAIFDGASLFTQSPSPDQAFDPHPLYIEAQHQWMLQDLRLHRSLWLHGVGPQLYTAWDAPITLRAINWYGFEYAPYIPDGLDRAPLDDILRIVKQSGFNALRLTFADETVARNPVVTQGLAANRDLVGLHSLDIMQRILERAYHFRLRVILCNSRSEGGMGPELRTGLWYTRKYPETAWQRDWITLVTRFKDDRAFVGADLRNEPHVTGQVFDTASYYAHGPLWGAFHETYYHDRDWRYAAQTMGNMLLAINPRMLIVVEGVQMYLDPYYNKLTGGLWGSNLIGVQYDPVVLSHPHQLVYSVHEYGPKMWLGSWFNAHTTYFRLAKRWTHLWGYLLTAPSFMQAPILVGEFGTCDDHYSCVASPKHIPTSGGFWFASFVRYLHTHPEVSWAYWALNTEGPFYPAQRDLYAFMMPDWKHVHPMLLHGLKPLLPVASK